MLCLCVNKRRRGPESSGLSAAERRAKIGLAKAQRAIARECEPARTNERRANFHCARCGGGEMRRDIGGTTQTPE